MEKQRWRSKAEDHVRLPSRVEDAHIQKRVNFEGAPEVQDVIISGGQSLAQQGLDYWHRQDKNAEAKADDRESALHLSPIGMWARMRLRLAVISDPTPSAKMGSRSPVDSK